MNQNVDLNGNLDFEHSLFSEIIGFYQILNAYTDISVSMYLVWLTMIDWPFFHISTLTFYSLLYCLSFGLATFFSLRYGESIVRFFLDKLIQRQPLPPGKKYAQFRINIEDKIILTLVMVMSISQNSFILS